MKSNFFADKVDKINVLDFIFSETDLQVVDLSSDLGQSICAYKHTEEITSKFDLDKGQLSATFNLWCPAFGGKITLEKINLNPGTDGIKTFKYSSEGLGLIQLYFGGISNNKLFNSHIGHNSEKRALNWEKPAVVNTWNWKEIEKTARLLNTLICKKWAVKKIGSVSVLSGAEKLEKKGIQLTTVFL